MLRVALQEYNLKYVDMIEEQLNEALTTYRKPVNGDNYVRRSNQRSLTVYCISRCALKHKPVTLNFKAPLFGVHKQYIII